jgi:hypothetical protein
VTQITPQQQPPPPQATTQPERRREIVRVMVLGTPLQFEHGKLWPQGPEQTNFGHLTVELLRIASWIQEHPEDQAVAKYTREYNTKKQALEELRAKLRTSEMPIECIVGEMNEITGDASTGMPARIEIFGIPFGLWAERQLTFSVRIPIDQCVVGTRHPLEEAVDYLEKFHAEGDDDDEDEDEDEEEEEDDEEEDTEPTVDDILVAATIEAVPQVQLEPREGGTVAILPFEAWEKIRAASDDWASAQSEDEEDEEEDDPAPEAAGEAGAEAGAATP